MQRSYSTFCLDLLSIRRLTHPISILYYRLASNSTTNSRFKSDSCEIEIDCSTWNARRRMRGGWEELCWIPSKSCGWDWRGRTGQTEIDK